MPPVAKSIEELFPLIEFCRNGNLKATSEWIAKNNPLDLPPGKKTRRASPLQVAIEKGFLTLTEVLLDGGADPMASNGSALAVAVERKRIDIARLLLDRGVPVNSVDFESVCYSGDSELIQLFLDRGADPFDDYPVYRGFLHCLKPIISVYKANIEVKPALQLQADMALCYFAKEDNLRGVSLLLWAGARPDVPLPEDDSKNEFGGSCALVEAVRAGHLSVLKRLKPERYPDKFPELLQACSSGSSAKILEYLLTLFPNLTSLPDTGSSVLEHAIWQMSWAADPRSIFGTRSSEKIDACIDAIEILVKHGAKWKPASTSVNSARRDFRHLEPPRILRVFTILKEHQAADIGFLESLVSTPTMRSHLGNFSQKIAHLFHPPPMKTPAPTAAKPEVPAETPKATLSELRERAENFILGLIRKVPAFDFWKTELWESLENNKVRRVLGMSKQDERSCYEILEAAIEKINNRARSFKISLDGQNGYVSSITITLLRGKEWDDVCNEVWPETESNNPKRITEPAMRLLSWVKEHGSSDAWVKERTLSWHAGFNGQQGCIGEYLKELRKKIGPSFCYESKGQRWNRENPVEYKVWLLGEISVDDPLVKESIPERLNSIFEGRLDHITKTDLDSWRDLIHNHLINSRPVGKDPVNILWINDRAELERVFPSYPFGRHSDGQEIAKFISEIPVHREIHIGYDFRSDTDVWFVRLAPAKTWESTLRALQDLLDQPRLEVRYGISQDAARLLEWIEGLRDKDYLLKWTPVVEDQLEKKIGLTCPWDKENFPAFLAELLNELNDRTPYELALQPWKCYSECKTRIRVSRKKSDESVLIQQIQFLALKHGKIVNEDRIREFIPRLLE